MVAFLACFRRGGSVERDNIFKKLPKNLGLTKLKQKWYDQLIPNLLAAIRLAKKPIY